MSVTARWAKVLVDTHSSDKMIQSWKSLRTAIATHQKLLEENGIGTQVSQRDRVRVNARRVGLEAPLFADEAEASFADILGGALERRAEAKRHDETENEVTAKVTNLPI